MKSTEEFKRTIKRFLDEKAAIDPLFAASYAKEGKSLEQCITFILNSVKESGCNGFTDDEIYGIAVHYYDEDELDEKYLKQVSGNVVVNHQVQLTEEEKAEMEKKAKDDYYAECLKKQKELNQPKKKTTETPTQASLFDF